MVRETGRRPWAAEIPYSSTEALKEACLRKPHVLSFFLLTIQVPAFRVVLWGKKSCPHSWISGPSSRKMGLPGPLHTLQCGRRDVLGSSPSAGSLGREPIATPLWLPCASQ